MLIFYVSLSVMGLTISSILFMILSNRYRRKKQISQLFVRTPSGCTMTIQLDGLQFVGDLRRAIQQRFTTRLDFRLHFKSKELVDKKRLCDYGIQPDCTIFLLGRLKGGPLSTSDFMYKSRLHPKLSTPTASRHLKNIPGMSKSATCKEIFSELQNGSFSLKNWFDSLANRTKSNLENKKCEIYWGAESVVGSIYDCAGIENEPSDMIDEISDSMSIGMNDLLPEDSMNDAVSMPLTCSERELRELEILNFKIINLRDISRAKQLQIIPLYSEWSSNNKLWSNLTSNPDFSLMDIVDFKEDKQKLFFERLKQKKLILRLGDFILGHPGNIKEIYKISSKGKKRDRMRMENAGSIEDAETTSRDNLTKLFESTFDVYQKQIEKWTSNLLGHACALKQISCFCGLEMEAVKQCRLYDYPSTCDVCKAVIVADDQMYTCPGEHAYDKCVECSI